jgi:glycosyltransferase involved in cell wall biosynthesis
MRVALVHSRYRSDEPSGENTVVDNEVAALERAGVEVTLIERASDELAAQPLRSTRAALRVATGRGANPLDEIRDWGPDIVHVHNLFPNFGTAWLERLDVPCVCTVHNFRAVCASANLFRDGAPCTDCVDGSALSGLVHRCYRDSIGATLPLTIAQASRPGRDRTLRAVRRVITLSERTRSLYVDRGLPSAKVVVSPNFLPDADLPAPTTSDREDFFLYVGRLTEDKGILRLAERWPRGQRLKVAGAGPAEAALARIASSDIELIGRVSRVEVGSIMQRARALIVPSLWSEQFPMVYLEALAHGTPVLAFDSNVVADLVTQDATGAVCGWHDDLADALRRVSSLPDQVRLAAAAMGDRYSERAYIQRVTALYEQVMTEG